MKILVAEDDAVSLRLIERMLDRSGYEVVTARNGRQAVEILSREDAPRLALMDWVMPELDGPTVCREVRRRQAGSYVYILLLTAKQSREDVVIGLQAGADDYLTKPCHSGELEARLHTGRRILALEDELVMAREEMRHRATHDGLTSLWDRTAIVALLRSELSRSTRTAQPVSIILCDADRFKSINDKYGHLVGDEVLRGISDRLSGSVRLHDSVGRYGGEEFMIVLSNCSANDVQERAEEVRLAVSVNPILTSHGPLSVSVSLGAVTVEHWDRSVPIEHFLMEADAALYRAKAAGRNCVVFVEASVLAH